MGFMEAQTFRLLISLGLALLSTYNGTLPTKDMNLLAIGIFEQIMVSFIMSTARVISAFVEEMAVSLSSPDLEA